MATYTTSEIIRILKEKGISLFTLADFSRLFNIESDNTLYKKIQRLEKKRIIKKLIKGKYLFLFNHTDDFLIMDLHLWGERYCLNNPKHLIQISMPIRNIAKS